MTVSGIGARARLHVLLLLCRWRTTRYSRLPGKAPLYAELNRYIPFYAVKKWLFVVAIL